ncbi:MAG: sulfite exporter TauE/SafE family protein [Bacteroidales bacterium]|nr:sulfite exporter TauE/SafE family protein [Bacteroidales bacterium]
MELFWIVLVVVIASLVKGITGFGFALVALPPLMIWYSPKEIIPVLLLCNLFASVLIILQKKERQLINRQFKWLIIFGALFTIVGVIFLKYLPEHLLIVIVSIFLIILTVLSILGVQYPIKITNRSYKIAGAFLGFLTGSISISGPPMALFLYSAKVDKQQFREIFSWFSIVTSIVALAGYVVLGILTIESLKMSLLFLPILFIGSFIGKKLNNLIPLIVFKKAILIITLFSSVFILLK